MKGLLAAHSGLRWIVLVLLIMAIVKAFMGTKDTVLKDKKVILMAMISVHIQILIGFVLYVISPLMKGFFAAGDVMKASTPRFFVVEHLSMMVIAAVLLTMGYSKFKKREDYNKKYKAIKVLYVLALLIILFAIPWPFRGVGIDRGWF